MLYYVMLPIVEDINQVVVWSPTEWGVTHLSVGDGPAKNAPKAYQLVQSTKCPLNLPQVTRISFFLKSCKHQVPCHPPRLVNDRRKFRSQTSDNMERWKAAQGRGIEKRKIRRERVRGQKIQMREKVGKSRNTVFFQWFVAPEGRKVGSLKRRVRSQLARGEMKNCTPLWREAHFQVKMYKTHHSRTTFGSGDVEKVHAVVARSTFPSQNVQNTSASDHFWKLRCQKSARRCGAKHISKSKCTKHLSFGPLLEVAMSKKCTPLWREAHFQVKMYKTHHSRTTFGGSDVEKVSKKCTPLWREAHFEVKSIKNWGFWAFFGVKMSKK